MDEPVKVKRRQTRRRAVDAGTFETWEIVTFADEPTHGAWERFLGLCREEGGKLRQNFKDGRVPVVWLKDGYGPTRAAASYERRIG